MRTRRNRSKDQISAVRAVINDYGASIKGHCIITDHMGNEFEILGDPDKEARYFFDEEERKRPGFVSDADR